MTVFSKEKFPEVYHNLALVVTIIIFVGAVHEVSALVFGLLYDLAMLIRSKCSNQIHNSNQIQIEEQNKIRDLSQINKFGFKAHYPNLVKIKDAKAKPK